MQAQEKLSFLERNKLDPSYLEHASIWFKPIIETITEHHKSAKRTLILGINGSQGSGKTTLADYLTTSFSALGLSCVSISIDDFYLGHEERQSLAKEIHPLLATRGVPGTHDLVLAFKTLDALKNERSAVKIPRFDKAVDDRKSEDQWSTVQAPVDIIILEGWCVGIPAQAEQELEEAANELESTHDSQGTWRKYVNDQLREHYHPLWKEIDELIMLQAPSFDCVFQWRLEQEEKLVQANSGQNSADNKIMSAKEVENFIQHYERLTRHALEHLPQKSQYLLKLDAKRGITSFQNMNKDMNKGQSL